MRGSCTLSCMRKIYPTDLSDKEWAYLRSRLPSLPKAVRPRAHSLRDILDAIFYVLRSGCPWRMLPGDFPPWSTVYYHFRKFRRGGLWHRLFTVLRSAERQRVGKDPNPSAGIMDSQSVKTVEESARICGYDAHKHVKGRKRHLLVDTLGLPLASYVTPAGVQDRAGARLLLAGLEPLVPCLKKIWVDGAYSGEEFARWCKERGGWEIEVVERDKKVSGFKVVPKRWIVERTFAWISRNRRLAKDYERRVQTSETLIEIAMIRLLLRRLAKAV